LRQSESKQDQARRLSKGKSKSVSRSEPSETVAPCWFVVHLRVKKRETIIPKEGRNESDDDAKA
jgi:hypothetical protein